VLIPLGWKEGRNLEVSFRWATNEAITVVSGTAGASVRQNLSFHKNAFALAMAPLEKPPGAVQVSRQSYKRIGQGTRGTAAGRHPYTRHSGNCRSDAGDKHNPDRVRQRLRSHRSALLFYTPFMHHRRTRRYWRS
jgi:hypothetical protein